jgi:hypothetical protein
MIPWTDILPARPEMLLDVLHGSQPVPASL